jgi:hypothetical protein
VIPEYIHPADDITVPIVLEDTSPPPNLRVHDVIEGAQRVALQLTEHQRWQFLRDLARAVHL